jgi:hypothetical protein
MINMKWKSALKWAFLVWLALAGVAIAISWTAEPGRKPALVDLVLALAVAYPLSAYVIRETAADWAAFRAAYLSRSDEADRP